MIIRIRIKKVVTCMYFIGNAKIRYRCERKKKDKKNPGIKDAGIKKKDFGDDILSRVSSTICASGLNDSVRDGKR
jgi:hypothetical protein